MSKISDSKTYLRDGRAPVPSNPVTSRVMSANRAKNTGPEQKLRLAIQKIGLKGYRLNLKTVPGKPDIAFTKYKVAVFVHGCFWHRCPYCKLRLPKANTAFWQEKFRKNRKRDKAKQKLLEQAGWRVLVFWECQITTDAQMLAEQIELTIAS